MEYFHTKYDKASDDTTPTIDTALFIIHVWIVAAIINEKKGIKINVYLENGYANPFIAKPDAVLNIPNITIMIIQNHITRLFFSLTLSIKKQIH